MLTKEIRQMIIHLYQKGQSQREISRLLHLSRNTIRRVIRYGVDIPVKEKNENNENNEKNQRRKALDDFIPILRGVYVFCKGNAVRIQEVLKANYGIEICYSTLTRFIQENGLRKPPRRVGHYVFEPGVEMQHDTSPHKIKIGETTHNKVQCASLVFHYSRCMFMQYYPCFTRFEAKSFLKMALEFMQGSCRRCVVDNTSVILAGGSGANAVIAPEMSAFSRIFGFEFMAHRINHADRKAQVERGFNYIENNFLAGRVFKDWDDLNQQARNWCITVSNKKEKRSLGMSPEAAFIQERPYLVPLPLVLPPIYEHMRRWVDTRGFIHVETNQYSAPERLIGKEVDVYKTLETVRIEYHHREVGIHSRLSGNRYGKSTLKGHHTQIHYAKINQSVRETEETLRMSHKVVNAYIAELKKHVRGTGLQKFNRLLSLKHTYPFEAFVGAIEQAHHYGLYDLNRLEDLIIKFVAGNYFNLISDEKNEKDDEEEKENPQ